MGYRLTFGCEGGGNLSEFAECNSLLSQDCPVIISSGADPERFLIPYQTLWVSAELSGALF
jgi:hypothetical protein